MSKLKGLNYLRKSVKSNPALASNTGNPIIDNLRNGNINYQNQFFGPTDNDEHVVDNSMWLTGRENPITTVVDGGVDEVKAWNQPWAAKFGAGVGRIGAKVAAEVAKMPGVVGGIAAGSAGQLSDVIMGEDNTDFMQTAFNNTWIKSINDANEYVNEEWLPVHVKKAVKEGDLWTNMMSVDFWATEGADGLGYILSMLVPGAAINRLKLGSKLFSGLSKYKMLGDKMDEAAQNLSKLGGKGLPVTPGQVDMWTITAANTLFEAGAEAQGAMDGFEKSLQHQLDEGKITPEQFEEEMKKASKIGRDVFAANAAILVGPNAIMTKMLWGGKANKALGKMKGDAGKIAKHTPSKMDKLGAVAKDVGTGIAREGFFEEGMQTTAEHYISDAYKNDTSYSLGGFASAYGDMLQTTEGQKAILLGSVFGGGMQGGFGVKAKSADRARQHELIDVANENIDSFRKVFNEDIYERDADGEIVYEKNPTTGEQQPKYDKIKIQEKLEGLDQLEMESLRYDAAVERGDTETMEMIRENAMTNLALPFVFNEQLGLEVFEQTLRESAETIKMAENEGIDVDTIISKAMDKAKTMKKNYTAFMDFAPAVIDIQHDEASNTDISEFYNKLAIDYIHHKEMKGRVAESLEIKNKQLNEILADKKTTRDQFDTDKVKNSAYRLKDARIDKLAGDIEYLTKKSKELEQRDEDFWNNEVLNKEFAVKYKAKKDLEKEVEEESKTAEDALDNIEKSKTAKEVDEISKGKPKEEEKRKKEEAAVNELIDRANANPSIGNLRNVLNDLNNLQVSSYSIQDIIENIESRVKELVEKQAEMKNYLDGVFDELSKSINETNKTIADLDEALKTQKRKRRKIAKDLAKEDKNPKGRNAKLIKELIAETEKELRLVDRVIEQLEKEKQSLEKDLDKLENRLEYVSNRYDQVEVSDFTSIEDIIDFLKENSKKFGEHRFEVERLMIHRHYAEQNLEGLKEVISGLETYREVLQETLREKLKDLDSSSHDLYFLQEQLNDTNEQLEEARKEFEEGQLKLKRLDKAVIHKQALEAITPELKFWEDLQKVKGKNKPSKAFNNPVVNKAAIEKKQRLAAEKKAKDELKLQEAMKAKELAEAFDKLREEGVVSNETYYNYVEDHMNEGEQLPNPPEGFPIPKNIKDKPADVPYYLNKKTDDKLTFSRDGSTFQVSRSSFGDTKKTSVTSTTSPVYQTEGGPTETYVETAQNLPKDKDGNIIEENLQTIKNDARVITGTDGGVNLPYVPKAMVTFERMARNKSTQPANFAINTAYAGTNVNQKKALEMLPNATPNDLEFLINHLPLNAVFAEGVYAPLETYNTNPNLSREARAEYDQIFDRSSKALRTAIIKEIVLNKTKISDISTTIAGQKNGSITVAPKENGKVAENSILELADIAGDMKNIKTKDIYVVNDTGALENIHGDIQDLGKDMAPGELYLMIKTANGTPFPLKLNVKKVTKPEAELLFEIYKHRFEQGTKKANKAQPITETNEAIVSMVKDIFKEELGSEGLFTKNKKTLDDLTVGDIVNFLIWDGTKSIKSQVRFDSTGGLRVFEKTYRKEDFANSKEEFVDLLTSEEKGRGKRRNISFKRSGDQDIRSFNLENRSYLEYIIDKKILNTNAITGKDEDGNYIPTFQGDTTIYLNTNNVRVSSKGDKLLSDYNVEKKVTFKNTLRGSEADLRQREKGLYTDELVLVEEGKDSYYVQKKFKNNPKRYRWERVSKVTALKDTDLSAANMYNAAKRGDVVDELVRVFFSKGFDSVDSFVQKGREEVDAVNKRKDKHGDIIMSDNSFKELWNIVREYEIEFNRRGYTIYANTNPLFGELTKNKKRVKVGGAMDLLAKDKLGAYHIIDIKTSTIDRYEDYSSPQSYYLEKDKRQQNAYAELFYQRTGKRVSSILIMPITVKSEKDEEVTANSLYRNIARTKAPTGFIEVDTSKDIYQLMGEEKITSEDKRKVAGFKKDKGKGQRNAGLLGGFAQEMEQISQDEAGIHMEFEAEGTMSSLMEELEAEFGDIDINNFSKGKKATPKQEPKGAKSKKPSSRSAQGIDVDGGRYLLWTDGVVTTLEDRKTPIKDQAIIDKVLATAGKKAAPGGKSEEDVRKDEKKSVSLQKANKTMSRIDIDKLSEEEVENKLDDIMDMESLDKTLTKDLRNIDKKDVSEREKLKEMVNLLLDKAAANEDVKKICNIK